MNLPLEWKNNLNLLWVPNNGRKKFNLRKYFS